MFDFDNMSVRRYNFTCFFSLFIVQFLIEPIFTKVTAINNMLTSFVLLFFFSMAIFLGWYGCRLTTLKQGYLGMFLGLSCWSVEETLERIVLPAPDTMFCPFNAEHPLFWVRFEDLPFAFIITFLYLIILDFEFKVTDKIPLHLQVAFPFIMTGWILTGLARANRAIFEHRGPGAYLIVLIFASIFLISLTRLFVVRKEAAPIFSALSTGSLVSTVFGLAGLIKAL
ncbi:MAG: hypothetical protein HZA77_07175 [Candidatus Schekmanbacteria bacterium]|nr:hypothetical protein [Candidatus Schekmanbacteria bacterium]